VRLDEHPRVAKIPKRLVYCSLDQHHLLVELHAKRGGTGYCLRDGWLVELLGETETRIIQAAPVPITFNGTAEYQIANLFAAIAAARAYGQSIETIVAALLHYSGAAHNAGRGNLYRVGHGYVLVDYGHNPEAFAAVGRGLNKFSNGRLTAIIAVPGDRDDEVIRQAGHAAARYFDRLIIKEDKDLRGRQSRQVSQLLYQAAAEAMPGIERRVVLDARAALELAINELEAGEIVVIFYEQLETVLDVLAHHHAIPVISETAPNNLPIGAAAATRV
jgi:cyanophycin synthetase